MSAESRSLLPALRPAVFFDRDNTLVVDHGYTFRLEDFAWMNGAPAALCRIHAAGLPVFVVTNQGGVALGIFNREQLDQFHRHLRAETERLGARITDIASCIHHPKAIALIDSAPCSCRKPQPGMILDLAVKWRIDLRKSVMIGDRDSDVEAGERAGCYSYLFDGTDLDLLAREVMSRHF